MKNVLAVLGLLAVTAAAPAMAADMPPPTKAPPVAGWSWKGFYVGGHGGYGWEDDTIVDQITTGTPAIFVRGISSKGWVYGAQVGYNWQYGNWITGLEIDGSKTEINGSTRSPTFDRGTGLTTSETRGDKTADLASARARVGYALSSGCCWNSMVYATGGVAWERFDSTDLFLDTSVPLGFARLITKPITAVGWVAGAGGEMQVADTNWLLRVEYLHYDFGTVTRTNTVVSNLPSSSTDLGGHQTMDVVRGALSYKFGPRAP
jgi:outer membrane immunogenic protein